MAMLQNMDRRMTKMDQTIHAIRKAQVYYSSGDRFDNDWRKPKKEWLPYDEYKKAKEEKYNKKAKGFYQKEEPVQERKPNLKEMLTKFVFAFEKIHNDTDAAIQEQRKIIRNQKAFIHNIEKQLGQLAQQINQRQPGELPSNTEKNRRMDHLNSITTYSERFFTPMTPEQKTSVEEYRKFMEHIKALQVNLPFTETILQTICKLVESLFASRKYMAKVVELVLNELPEKRGDPGSISIPCQFGNIIVTHVLTDSGASINLMPYSFFKKLNLTEPKPTQMTIHLADKTIIHAKGMCEDLLIKVDKYLFPVDFVVLDMEEDPKVPIILGRPFLNTACALVDVCESTLTLRVGNDSVVFKAKQEKKHEETKEDKVFSIDLDDEVLERELALLQEENRNQFLLSSKENFDAERDL
ncbi:uncharacterized protein LOC111911826 [Lactuca sativa]|uniref:uncharacterized protein LOC111911826 n=1 Tax=Lactuca sativa TaxID=4236 RepID=UPI000CD85CF7|nr:uncharacterized protein LOC111911826 [Lactuca sativa]